jgi:hypothetical protein
MREAFFILLVIALILALTAYKYRLQVGAVYRFWKVLRSAGSQRPGEIAPQPETVKGPTCELLKMRYLGSGIQGDQAKRTTLLLFRSMRGKNGLSDLRFKGP